MAGSCLVRELRNLRSYNTPSKPEKNDHIFPEHMIYNTSILTDPKEPLTICDALTGPDADA